jgi:hypothetical protein
MRLSEFFVAPTIMGLAARIEALPVKAISDKDETAVRASSSRPSGLTGNREEIVL